MSYLTRSAALGIPVLVLTACIPRAGTEQSLIPGVTRIAGTPSDFRVVVDSGAYVSVFAVMSRDAGWSLRLLTPDQSGAAAPAARIVTYSLIAPIAPAPGDSVMVPVHVPCAYRYINLGRSDTTSFLDVDCSTRLGDKQRVIRFPSRHAAEAQPSGYYLIVSSRSSRPASEWSALADSLGVVGILNQVPGKFGRLAFGEPTGRGWAIAVRQVPYRL